MLGTSIRLARRHKARTKRKGLSTDLSRGIGVEGYRRVFRRICAVCGKVDDQPCPVGGAKLFPKYKAPILPSLGETASQAPVPIIPSSPSLNFGPGSPPAKALHASVQAKHAAPSHSALVSTSKASTPLLAHSGSNSSKTNGDQSQTQVQKQKRSKKKVDLQAMLERHREQQRQQEQKSTAGGLAAFLSQL